MPLPDQRPCGVSLNGASSRTHLLKADSNRRWVAIATLEEKDRSRCIRQHGFGPSSCSFAVDGRFVQEGASVRIRPEARRVFRAEPSGSAFVVGFAIHRASIASLRRRFRDVFRRRGPNRLFMRCLGTLGRTIGPAPSSTFRPFRRSFRR